MRTKTAIPQPRLGPGKVDVAVTAIKDSNADYIITRDGTGVILVNGATITKGSAAAVTDGQAISTGSDMIAIGIAKASLVATSSAVVSVTLTQEGAEIMVAQDPSASSVYIANGSVRLTTAGGAAQTLDGVRLSSTTNGIVKDGRTVSLATPTIIVL